MKTNWNIINKARVRDGYFASQDSDGFNGAFCLLINGMKVKAIASDTLGCQHVSVSLASNHNFCPSWDIMCKVKELFWGDDEWVVQYHPPADKNISNHPGCLHLWRPVAPDALPMPIPPSEMVGLKDVGEVRADQAIEILAQMHARHEQKD